MTTPAVEYSSPTPGDSTSRPLSLDRAGRARVNAGPCEASVVIDVSSADQTLATPARGIYVGVAGNLVCRLVGDSTDRTFTGLLAGSFYPFALSIVRKTSTTVTSCVALL